MSHFIRNYFEVILSIVVIVCAAFLVVMAVENTRMPWQTCTTTPHVSTVADKVFVPFHLVAMIPVHVNNVTIMNPVYAPDSYTLILSDGAQLSVAQAQYIAARQGDSVTYNQRTCK